MMFPRHIFKAMPALTTRVTLLFCIFACCNDSYAQFSVGPAQQISVGIGGTAPQGASSDPVAAPNANFIAFSSNASNLVPGDTNGLYDVFQYSPAKGVELVSVSAVTGSFPAPNANGRGAGEPAFSNVLPDGTYAVAFTSDSTDIVPGYQSSSQADGNPRQVYLRLPLTNQTFLVSQALSSASPQNPVGAESNCDQVSVIAQVNPTRFTIAFRSAAKNLHPDYSGTQPYKTVFMFTITPNGSTLQISKREAAARLPNGNPLDGDVNSPSLSGNGAFVIFSSTGSFGNFLSTGKEQIYQFDRATQSCRHISKNPLGQPANDDCYSPSISFRGEAIAFMTKATDLVTPFIPTHPIGVVFSSRKNAIKQVNVSSNSTPSDGSIYSIRVSPNGKMVAFADDGSNLVSSAGPVSVAQTYIKAADTGLIARTSFGGSGTPGDGDSGAPPRFGDSVTPPLALGSLGFNSPTIFTAFRSAAQNLTQYGTSSDTSPNVFRSLSTPPPPVFQNRGPIETPPDVTITRTLPGGRGASVRIELQKFVSSSSSALSTNSFIDFASQKAKIRYDLEVKKTGSKFRIKKVLSRNTTTIRKLSPGTYTVKYRVSKTIKKKTSRSGYSPTTSIQIN